MSFSLKPGASLGAAIDHVNRGGQARAAGDGDDEPAGIGEGVSGVAVESQPALLHRRSASSTSCSACCTRATSIRSRSSPGCRRRRSAGCSRCALFGNELNIYSFVGLILLIGLVMKNAIMQIDFALDAERQRDMSPADAIYEGCIVRFRPIMMTRMATLLGALPIALGFGSGGEARRPLGPRRRRRAGRVAGHHAVSDARRVHVHGDVGEDAQDSGGRRRRHCERTS